MLPHVDEFRPIHNLELHGGAVPGAVGSGGRAAAIPKAG